MNELKVFQNSEFGELGILLIDGKEYFPATQCAKTLGYKNARDAILRLKGNSNIRKQLLQLPHKLRPVHHPIPPSNIPLILDA